MVRVVALVLVRRFDGNVRHSLELSRLPERTPESNSTDWQDTYSFMSRHRSGANFAMCDGSVHYINEQIDLQVYQALATIDGNEAVTVPDGWPPGNAVPVELASPRHAIIV